MPDLGARARRATSKLSSQRVLFGGTALRQHERRAPSPQTVIDAFEGEWFSRFPDEVGVKAGDSPTFDDPRLHWSIPKLDVAGASVLELGPLEGGHSYMLERAGAASILAIESNRRAFLRCLATKELVDLRATRFECGDFLEFLRASDETFDVCVACGVLYHLLDPVELLALLSRRARRVFIWTHHYDPEVLAGSRRFGPPTRRTTEGFEHQLHPRPYSRIGIRLAGFPGGSNRSAAWLGRADLIGALAHFGWSDVEVGGETRDTYPGPAISLVARNPALG